VNTGEVRGFDPRSAHQRLLAVTGAASQAKGTTMAGSTPPTASVLLHVFLANHGGDEACYLEGYICTTHKSGMLNGDCVVWLAKRLLGREAERTVSADAGEHAADTEPPDVPPLPSRLALADLWDVLDNDRSGLMASIVAKSGGTTKHLAPNSDISKARYVVEAVVDRYVNGDDR